MVSSGGAPVSMASGDAPAQDWTTGGYRVGENNVVTRTTTAFNDADVYKIATTLGAKWGVVPPFGNPTGDVLTLTITGLAGGVAISRIGFYLSAANAVAGTSATDLVYNKMGFVPNQSDWSVRATARSEVDGTYGSFIMSANGTQDMTCVVNANALGVPTLLTGALFVRISYATTSPNANVANTRMYLTLRHFDGSAWVPSYYGLGFAYDGDMYNTATSQFMDVNGGLIARNGCFQLVRSQAVGKWSDASGAWNAAYTDVLDVRGTLALGIPAQTFAKINSISRADFTTEFKTECLANIATGMTWAVYASSTGQAIPSWNWTMTNSTSSSLIARLTYDPSGATYPAGMTSGTVYNSKYLIPFGNFGYGLESTHWRMVWTFQTASLVKSLMLYTSYPGWKTPTTASATITLDEVRFEVVGSNDMVTFERIATRWNVNGVNVVEDTFHLRWDRKRKGGEGAWVFASTLAPLVNEPSNSSGVPPVTTAASWFLTKATTVPFLCFIDLVNSSAYKYYGLGLVGSNLTKNPCGGKEYCDWPNPESGGIYTWLNWSAAQRTAKTGQQQMNVIIPRVLAAPVFTIAPVVRKTYKYWRLRLSSAVLGMNGYDALTSPLEEISAGAAGLTSPPSLWQGGSVPWTYICPNQMSLWKLGLYKSVALAASDTGLCSDNYVQVAGNDVTNSASNNTSETNVQLKYSYLPWSSSSSAATNIGNIFWWSDTSPVQIKLDVTSEISVIQFPPRMRFNMIKRPNGDNQTVNLPIGAAFLLERSTDATTWTAVIATTNSGKQLGRHGLFQTVMVDRSNAADADPLYPINTRFVIEDAPGLYVAPNGLGSTSPASLRVTAVTPGCTVRLLASGGNAWTPNMNQLEDFNVNIVTQGAALWVPGLTTFNCTVTGYSTSTGTLTFTAAPTPAPGDCTLVVFIRNGEGTGVISATLTTTVTITGSSGFWLMLDANAAITDMCVKNANFATGVQAITNWTGLPTMPMVDKTGWFTMSTSSTPLSSPSTNNTYSVPTTTNLLLPTRGSMTSAAFVNNMQGYGGFGYETNAKCAVRVQNALNNAQYLSFWTRGTPGATVADGTCRIGVTGGTKVTWKDEKTMIREALSMLYTICWYVGAVPCRRAINLVDTGTATFNTAPNSYIGGNQNYGAGCSPLACIFYHDGTYDGSLQSPFSTNAYYTSRAVLKNCFCLDLRSMMSISTLALVTTSVSDNFSSNHGGLFVVAWKALGGTNPNDRFNLQCLSLVININPQAFTSGLINGQITSTADLSNWLQLYQNGEKLTLVTQLNSSAVPRLSMMSGALSSLNLSNSYLTRPTSDSNPWTVHFPYQFFQDPNGDPSSAPIFNDCLLVGGTGVLQNGGLWSIGEFSHVSRATSAYTQREVHEKCASICGKWGIVESAQYIRLTLAGDVTATLGRIGLYRNTSDAIVAANDLTPTVAKVVGTNATVYSTSTDFKTTAGTSITLSSTPTVINLGSVMSMSCLRLSAASVTLGTAGNARLTIELSLDSSGAWTPYYGYFASGGVPTRADNAPVLSATGWTMKPAVLQLVRASWPVPSIASLSALSLPSTPLIYARAVRITLLSATTVYFTKLGLYKSSDRAISDASGANLLVGSTAIVAGTNAALTGTFASCLAQSDWTARYASGNYVKLTTNSTITVTLASVVATSDLSFRLPNFSDGLATANSTSASNLRLKVELSSDGADFSVMELQFTDASGSLCDTRTAAFCSAGAGSTEGAATYGLIPTNSGVFGFKHTRALVQLSTSEMANSTVASNVVSKWASVQPTTTSTCFVNAGASTGGTSASYRPCAFGDLPGIYSILGTYVGGNQDCMVTSSAVTIGSAGSYGGECTIYVLCRGDAGIAPATKTFAILSGQNISTQTSNTDSRESYIVRETNESNTAVSGSFLRGNSRGYTSTPWIKNASKAPQPLNHEVLCFVKTSGSYALSVYRNNVSMGTSTTSLNSWTSSSFWRLGSGCPFDNITPTSNYVGGTMLGAFRIYNVAHGADTRRYVYEDLISVFGNPIDQPGMGV
jgi:hypothetical protein